MATEKYYVPESSPWPLAASVGLFLTAVGGANFIQQATDPDTFQGSWGMPLFFVGLARSYRKPHYQPGNAAQENNGLHCRAPTRFRSRSIAGRYVLVYGADHESYYP